MSEPVFTAQEKALLLDLLEHWAAPNVSIARVKHAIVAKLLACLPDQPATSEPSK